MYAENMCRFDCHLSLVFFFFSYNYYAITLELPGLLGVELNQVFFQTSNFLERKRAKHLHVVDFDKVSSS